MTQATDDFFGNAPSDYEVPKSDSQYMSFKTPGTYKFRILQAPIFGYTGWKIIDGKNTPFRFPMDQKPKDTSAFKEGKLTHFWAMPVFNLNTGKVEVLEVTQKSIQESIEVYARSEWGSPLGYNLIVTREGTGRDDTKYTTMNTPISELSDEGKAAWEKTQAAGFDITELYRDGNPFEPTSAPEAAPAAVAAPVEPTVEVTPETAPAATQDAPEVTQPVDTATPPN